MQKTNILLLGSGGRESALAWKLSQSPRCGRLFIAPGNAGTPAYGQNVSLSPLDFESLAEFCMENRIDLLLSGPEDPLAAGLVDYFSSHPGTRSIQVLGPAASGAKLESSKAFAKEFMIRHGIPTAPYRVFDSSQFTEGEEYIRGLNPPIVLKADGLAAGKGVIIAASVPEALKAFGAMIQGGEFGDAGSKVVIESFLQGTELSVFALTDGKNHILLPEAKDYKRIGEGDKGPNTGGMGAVSPVPFVHEEFLEKIRMRIIEPTIKGLAKDGIPYQGFLFFGLIQVGQDPYVIEYNCRLGDPETEAILPRIQGDLLSLILSIPGQNLDQDAAKIQISPQCAATVILASEGYPGPYPKGRPITGLDQVRSGYVFHAGTRDQNGEVQTQGGRVMALTALGDSLEEALNQSYRNAELISFPGKQYRRDIGYEFR